MHTTNVLMPADEVETLQRLIKRTFPRVKRDAYFSWNSPPLNVLDCVLSLNRNYDRFCLPRVKRFAKRRPGVRTLRALRGVIKSYSTPGAFSEAELDYRHPGRADIVLSVTDYLIRIQDKFPGRTEAARLERWAVTAEPDDFRAMNIPGFALSGFQYLRMLFGAQTSKPDIHIRRFVGQAIGRRVSDVEALSLLESAAQGAKLPLRDLDYAIWNRLARG